MITRRVDTTQQGQACLSPHAQHSAAPGHQHYLHTSAVHHVLRKACPSPQAGSHPPFHLLELPAILFRALNKVWGCLFWWLSCLMSIPPCDWKLRESRDLSSFAHPMFAPQCRAWNRRRSWMLGWIDGWMDGKWVGGWTDGWMHGWMHGWIGE